MHAGIVLTPKTAWQSHSVTKRHKTRRLTLLRELDTGHFESMDAIVMAAPVVTAPRTLAGTDHAITCRILQLVKALEWTMSTVRSVLAVAAPAAACLGCSRSVEPSPLGYKNSGPASLTNLVKHLYDVTLRVSQSASRKQVSNVWQLGRGCLPHADSG
jgi:hypothetical protein